MNKDSLHHSLLLVALASLVAACGGSETKAAAPSGQASVTRSMSPINPKPEDNATRGNISISYNVRKACGLTDAEAYFAFDSSHVRPQDKQALRALAECFMSGPLKGRQMSLIGHADPRGTEDYNIALAGRRADNVKLLIVGESMDENRVSTSSRGAMDATGTDEASWAKDRSVDVKLGS